MTINTWFEQNFTNVPEIVKLFARCVGNGAANPTGVKGLGITSITWVSTGKYTVTLNRKFAGLVNVVGSVINSAGTTLSVVYASAETVASSQTITIEVFGGINAVAPTRRDLTSADTLLLEITLQDSSVKPAGF